MSAWADNGIDWSDTTYVVGQEQKEFTLGDRQLDMMASLAVMLHARKHCELIPTMLEESKKVLKTLNWIATCFVKDAVEDVVATSLVVLKGQITIYIATNRGKATEEDRQNAEKITVLIKKILEETDEAKMANAISETVSNITHIRFARKLDLLESMKVKSRPPTCEEDPTVSEAVDVQTRFNSVVDRWVANGNVETCKMLLNCREKLGLDATKDGNESLKDVFGALIKEIRNCRLSCDTATRLQIPGDDKTILKRYKFYCLIALALVASDFFKALGQPHNPGWKFPFNDWTWIRKLGRRLWRIARYPNDTIAFIREGIPYIRKVLGEEGVSAFLQGSRRIEFVWVGDQPDTLPPNHSTPYKMPPGPQYMNDLFEHFEYQLIPEEQSKETNQFETLWPEHGIRPHLHCELQMIKYLEKKNIPIYKGYIGRSKLMCWSCHAYVTEVNRERTFSQRWVLSGTSNKPRFAWLIPEDAIGNAVFQKAQNELENSIQQVANALGSRRRSDSYCGDVLSMDMKLLLLGAFS